MLAPPPTRDQSYVWKQSSKVWKITRQCMLMRRLRWVVELSRGKLAGWPASFMPEAASVWVAGKLFIWTWVGRVD